MYYGGESLHTYLYVCICSLTRAALVHLFVGVSVCLYTSSNAGDLIHSWEEEEEMDERHEDPCRPGQVCLCLL